ncbi:hypothetical protein EJ07DRAFT_126366 [Lizonia empirigonia]|nr:hypothetical protein EJ07DRAFT_126366 [Lizonia empirigonia]
MKCSKTLLSLVAAIPVVRGAAFGGPTPTAACHDRVLDGTSPRPTIPPSNDELKKRQTNLTPETCGWVDGIYSLGVTCPGSRTCMLYTSAAFGMAGCCDGADTVNCGWASSCIDANAYKSQGCGTNCLLDSFIRKCTAATAPYCVTWSYPSNGIYDYGCAANSDSSISTVFQTAVDAFGATTSMALPTVAASTIDTNSGTTRKTKKLAIRVIIGIVVAALFLLFCVAIGVLFCVKKKRKQRQITANTQAMTAVQATRPQSQYPPPQQTYQHSQQQQPAPMQTQMQQPSLYHPPGDSQSPVSTTTPYFAHATHEEKPNAHTSVHEYAVTPISSPSTPAPYQAPAQAYEVDAVSAPRVPSQGVPVHEMGSVK